MDEAGKTAHLTGRDEAQRRVERIRAFRREMDRLERDGVLSLTPDLKERLRRHHDAVLEQLASTYDVDRSDAEKQLSVGMRLVALLGAVALSAAVFSFFNRFWSAFSTPAQASLADAQRQRRRWPLVGGALLVATTRSDQTAGLVLLVILSMLGGLLWSLLFRSHTLPGTIPPVFWSSVGILSAIGKDWGGAFMRLLLLAVVPPAALALSSWWMKRR